MSNKLLSLLFLIYLSYTYCSECSEKRTSEKLDDDPWDVCAKLSNTDPGGYYCNYNSRTERCEEFYCHNSPSDFCGAVPNSANDEQCLPKKDNSGCEYKTCETLSNTECSKFVVYEANKACVPDGDSCQILQCEQMSPNICESIEFQDIGSKCVKSGSGCILATCNSMTESTCGEFIPVNKLYKCYFDDGYGCTDTEKECSDFDIGECNLFNTEDNPVYTDGEKCVESDGMCVLIEKESNSKMLEFSAFILLIIFLLF